MTDPGTEPRVDLGTAHRVLRFLCLVLAGGVVAFAVVAYALHVTETFPPFLGFPSTVRIGIAVFLVGLLAVSYPLAGLSGGTEPPTTPEEALSRLQMRVMVANGTRDAAGFMGCVLILLSGDVILGGTVAALSVITILLSIPSREDVEAAVRQVSRR